MHSRGRASKGERERGDFQTRVITLNVSLYVRGGRLRKLPQDVEERAETTQTVSFLPSFSLQRRGEFHEIGPRRLHRARIYDMITPRLPRTYHEKKVLDPCWEGGSERGEDGSRT